MKNSDIIGSCACTGKCKIPPFKCPAGEDYKSFHPDTLARFDAMSEREFMALGPAGMDRLDLEVRATLEDK